MSVAKLDNGSPFIGRHEQMRWVERLVFSQRGSISPIVICGPFGVGKTAFAFRFLKTRMPHVRVLHVSCAPSAGFANVWRELERQIRPVYESEEFAVVLDEIQGIGAGDLSALVNAARNYKRLRSIFIIGTEDPKIPGAPVLTFVPMSSSAAIAFFRELVGTDLPRKVLEQAAASTQGLPRALVVLAQVFKHGGITGLSKVLNGLIYDVSSIAPPGKILTVAKPRIIIANDELMSRLRKEPKALYKLPPRKFEELLADLLKDLGMEVELTQETRDGGRDILAFLKSPVGKLLCLVEAKRYREDRKIGVGLVRTLYGTLCDHQATSAMMVTTSSYSADARAFQERHKYELSLKEFGDVVNWIDGYGQGRRSP